MAFKLFYLCVQMAYIYIFYPIIIFTLFVVVIDFEGNRVNNENKSVYKTTHSHRWFYPHKKTKGIKNFTAACNSAHLVLDNQFLVLPDSMKNEKKKNSDGSILYFELSCLCIKIINNCMSFKLICLVILDFSFQYLFFLFVVLHFFFGRGVGA